MANNGKNDKRPSGNYQGGYKRLERFDESERRNFGNYNLTQTGKLTKTNRPAPGSGKGNG